MQLKQTAIVPLFIFEAMYVKAKRFWETLFNWELWPFALRYLFISPAWAWYCIRSGSPWFFTSSNPTITFGGFEGEGKKEMYDQLPEHVYPNTIYVLPTEPFEQVKARVAAAGLSYPFCAKPDVGMKGLLFRKIDSEADLLLYHSKMPVEYIVQELILYPLEVSVFYYRYPNRQTGVISGFIQKDLMEVTGDGEKTLLQLIQEHPIAKHRGAEMRIKHSAQLDRILLSGERYPLTYAANLSRGARFVNLFHLADAQLLQVFDDFSLGTQFYYGRYDIKCQSVDDLKAGRHFSILEFNGSGAEPNHVYHTGYSLFAAQRVFLQHWKVLYQIARYNHLHGVPYWPFLKGWKFTLQAKKHLRLLEEYEAKILL